VLLTLAKYQTTTGDVTTSSDAFATAAAEAQSLLEDALGRPGLLESAERTESLELHGGGYVYPNAVPVTDAPGLVVHDDIIYGATLDIDDLPLIEWSISSPQRASVTYTGGWTSATAPGYMLRDLAFATWAVLHPEDLAEAAAIPAGATAAKVGDVALSFGADGAPGSSGRIGASIAWSAETLRHRPVTP
jgi:hypothetical protein